MRAAACHVLQARSGLFLPSAETDTKVALNASVRADINARFSEMDLSQTELRLQLDAIRTQISSQVPGPHVPCIVSLPSSQRSVLSRLSGSGAVLS